MSLYELLESIIGWTYSSTSSQTFNSTIMYGAVALCLIFVALTIDLIYKLLLRFLPNNLR